MRSTQIRQKSTRHCAIILWMTLPQIPDFPKLFMSISLRRGSVSGKQLCLILYDQGVLAYDAEEISSLESNAVSPVSFLKDKIKNIEITPAQLALDPCSGSCVITDVKTGELLALVSYPGYDNNRLANTVDADYFACLNTDLSKPLYNYATQNVLHPDQPSKWCLPLPVLPLV